MLSLVRLVPLALLLLSLVAATAISQDEKNPAEKKVAGPKVALQTVYLGDPIGDAHQILLQGELGGKGKLTLDGNTCTITQFGNRGVCTKIHFRPLQVEITQLRLADESGEGRRIFELKSELTPEGFRYFLIVPRRRSQAHRLVVDMPNDHRRVVTLEASPAVQPGKPQLAKSAKYRAEQTAGKVTLFAQGEHPTSAWKIAFEQLPIKIFPPHFRLVEVKPAVAAQVVTPFEVSTSFKTAQQVPKVTVHDDAGRHLVPVVQK